MSRFIALIHKIFEVFLFDVILVMAIGGRSKPKICLSRRLRWTLLLKERYGNWLSGHGSNTQPSSWEADTLRTPNLPLGRVTLYQ